MASIASPISSPAPAAAPPAAPAAAPSAAPSSTPSTPSAPIEIFSESDLTPKTIEDELSTALSSPATTPDPEPIAAPAAAVPPAGDDPGIAEPVAEPAAEATPAVAAPATPPAEVVPLPEGVKVRKVDGVEQWVVDPKAGQALAARAGLVEAAEQILGEPLTKESLQLRQNVVEGFEGMRGDLLSDNPVDQANVVAHFQDVIQRAHAAGEIGHDAFSGFVNVALDRALAADPATAMAVEKHITRTVVDRLYNEALRTHDPEQAKILWSSAQQADKASFGKYRPLNDFTEGRKAAPPARFENRAAPAAPTAGGPPAEVRAQAEFRAWNKTTNDKIHTDATIATVDQILKDIPAEQKTAFPNQYNSTRDQLVNIVRNELRSDPQLQEQVRLLQKRAQLAVNPELRNQLTDEIVKRHATRAAQILKDKKGPILSEYAKLMAAASTKQTQRATAGANAGRNAAPGGGPSASRSNPQPPKTAKFESGDDMAFGKELDAAFG